MKKIKLIIFHPYSYVGGADNSIKRLIEQLDTRLFSITFISLNESFLKKNLKKKVEFIKINGAEIIRMTFSFFTMCRCKKNTFS